MNANRLHAVNSGLPRLVNGGWAGDEGLTEWKRALRPEARVWGAVRGRFLMLPMAIGQGSRGGDVWSMAAFICCVCVCVSGSHLQQPRTKACAQNTAECTQTMYHQYHSWGGGRGSPNQSCLFTVHQHTQTRSYPYWQQLQLICMFFHTVDFSILI